MIISFYCIYNCITNIKASKRLTLYLLLTSILLIALGCIIQLYSYFASKICVITILCLSPILYNRKKLLISISSSIITIGISYCIRLFSVFFTSIFCSIINHTDADIFVSASIAILQVLISILLIHLKRVKNGLSFFYDPTNLGIGLLISGFIVGVIAVSEQKAIDKLAFTILAIGIFISSIGLFLWIRKSITEHYRNKLQDKAEEHYQNTLAEKDKYIEQLTNSNTYLSKIVHRDNHLMGALQYSIEKFKNCNNEEEKDKILNEILTLANERGDLLLKEQKLSKLLPSTGLSMIDCALGNMYVKAAAHNIDFDLVVNEEIHYLINNIISQTNLETLLCDHIKDAIIAIEANNNIAGKILVTIEMVDNIYEISIKDNGVDFEVDTLSKLGIERITTHKDTGGSGIGFMTTFETLEKTNASLIIIEYKNKIPFSKSIIFRFDGLNRFIIKSYRRDELKETINRNDVIIL